MSHRLFLRIANDLSNFDEFFTLRYDSRGRRCFTTLQKCTSAIRQLAYDTAADSWDEYLKMSNRTSRECLYKLAKDVVKLYSTVYLRKPTKNDVEKLYIFHAEKHGFPGMLGSIDCSNNDINVLARSEVFDDIIKGTGPDTSFMLNEVQYKNMYYLANGIYSEYSVIVKTILHLSDEKRTKYAKCQEATKKDVERLFGVLKGRWHIINNLACAFTPKSLRLIMYGCIIMHNMILEDKGRALCEYDPNDIEENVESVDER